MSSNDRRAILYLVATPIGNLEDLSARAARVLREADLIAAEDTRRAAKLLSHLGISKPVESFHGDSGPAKVERLLRVLREGKSIALVSDAGVPTISDPGADLVSATAAEGFVIVPIPGPSAIPTALSVSGFNADRFVFAGYPPRKRAERLAFFSALAEETRTVVLYEAPHRVRTCLADMAEALQPDRRVVIGRELTKLHEEVLRGTAAELATHFTATEPLGEFVVVLEGARPIQGGASSIMKNVQQAARKLAESGVSARNAAEVLALLTDMSKNEAYQLALNTRKALTSPEQ
jgi:16S rRNA (cytidine1402-2'-O)-methyltransferase